MDSRFQGLPILYRQWNFLFSFAHCLCVKRVENVPFHQFYSNYGTLYCREGDYLPALLGWNYNQYMWFFILLIATHVWCSEMPIEA